MSGARRHFLSIAVLSCCLVAAIPAALAAKGSTGQNFYSISDIFSKPGPTGYTPRDFKWSSDGTKLTFLLRQPGSKLADLYVVNTTTGKQSILISGEQLGSAAAPLATIENERRKERIVRYGLSPYHWSPQGDAIFYLRDNQVWLYSIARNEVRQITHEAGPKRDPEMSPNERWISYVTRGQLHYASVMGGTVYPVAKPEKGVINGGVDWVYREELHVHSGYQWSPDSRYIAFMQFDERPVESFPLVNYTKQNPTIYQQKYPLAGAPNPIVRMGVYSVSRRNTRWINHVAGTEETYLSRIGWLPGKQHKAYAVVLNRAQTELHLVTVNPGDGDVSLLFNAVDPYWVDVTSAPRFLPDGRFILPVYADGWKHLYLFGKDGDKIRDLTPGSFNVQFFAGLNLRKDFVFYTASPGHGPLYENLYSVPLGGGKPTKVTNDHGVHHVYLGPGGTLFLDHYSDATTPTSIKLRSMSGATVATIKATPELKYDLLKPRFFQIDAADGETKLYARMLVPPNFSPKKQYPVIMYQYGGPHYFSVVRDAWNYGNTLFDQVLARDGFIVFAVDNRAAGYFSHAAQAQVKYQLGKLELADQRAAVAWLRSQPYVEDQNIGIWGWSYGGYMTTYELTHAPDVWNAGIAVAPVTRWQDYDSIYTERYMGTPEKNEQGYEASSSVAAAGELKAPLLLVAGTGDDNVHWQNTIQFIQSLIRHNKPYQLLIYPTRTHAIPGTHARVHLYTAMQHFWKIHLQGVK